MLRTCYATSQQEALKEAFELMYGQNRHIDVKLEAEPSNPVDSCAIAVFIKSSVGYKKVGFIVGLKKIEEWTSTLNRLRRTYKWCGISGINRE